MFVHYVAIAPCGCAVSWLCGEAGSDKVERVVQAWQRRRWSARKSSPEECERLLAQTVAGGCPEHSESQQTTLGI